MSSKQRTAPEVSFAFRASRDSRETRERALSFALPTLAFALCLACSGVEQGSGGEDLAGGACNAMPKSVSGLGQIHVPVCSAISYPDNPPAGGNHYPVWAAYQSFSFPVPRGFWVHDLEHGGVVYSYNCAVDVGNDADGAKCAAQVGEVEKLIDALPVDQGCEAEEPRRVVLTPDPLLDVRWGLSAWGHTLRADCVDGDRFTQFYSNHFGRGPEQECGQGSDFGGMPPCP